MCNIINECLRSYDSNQIFRNLSKLFLIRACAKNTSETTIRRYCITSFGNLHENLFQVEIVDIHTDGLSRTL